MAGMLWRNLILVIGAYMAAENASQLVGVVTLLAAAVVAVPLFKRIGLGSVLGYLAAGLAIVKPGAINGDAFAR